MRHILYSDIFLNMLCCNSWNIISLLLDLKVTENLNFIPLIFGSRCFIQDLTHSCFDIMNFILLLNITYFDLWSIWKGHCSWTVDKGKWAVNDNQRGWIIILAHYLPATWLYKPQVHYQQRKKNNSTLPTSRLLWGSQVMTFVKILYSW